MAQVTVQDAESAIEVTPLPQMSVAALATAGIADTRHGLGSQVKVAKVPSVHVAVAMLAVYPGAQATVQDAECAIWVTPLPQLSDSA